MQAFTDVQAIVFDVFGTVVDWRSGVARESTAFLARYAPGVDPFAFADAWRRRYSPAMEEVRSGRRPFVQLDVLHRENLEAVFPAIPYCIDLIGGLRLETNEDVMKAFRPRSG